MRPSISSPAAVLAQGKLSPFIMMRVTATICALATQSRTENGEPSHSPYFLSKWWVIFGEQT
jgi:hypothetical protein